ncbi:MAG TPA: hypothetical protein ENG74_02230 [Thermoplasmatales archaeon]|nr:hypothetical protein [Thermoplasmatales archaeon]
MRKIWREIVFPTSIVLTVVGILLTAMGIVWIWFRDVNLGVFTDLVSYVENWNYYGLIAGIIIFPTGVFYLYDYLKKRKFLLEEIKTDRKSELVKKKAELEDVVKRLPKKYERMLREKEKELGIK